jgi:hypothetical protein
MPHFPDAPPNPQEWSTREFYGQEQRGKALPGRRV